MTELPYWPSEDGNTAVPSGYYSNGWGRLYVRESAIDESNNTSSVTITYQAWLQRSSSDFTRAGSISVNGDTRTISGKTSISTTGRWIDVQSWTWANIPHEEDGSKTITIQTSGGYGGPSLYVYQSSRRYANAVRSGTFTFELTKFERGVPVYIGGEEYYCYIGNEDGTWSAADPVIG